MIAPGSHAATPPKKPHVVLLGAARSVPYSKAGDPSGAMAEETKLPTRPLLVDGRVSEWTTGEAHEVTPTSFVVRRAVRINDTLPVDSPSTDAKPVEIKPAETKPATPQAHWVWQRGPWLLVDKVTAHATVLKLLDYDPSVSQVAWFRDYAAYCGITPSGKSLNAIVTQLGVRKSVLTKKLLPYDTEDHPKQACDLPDWQREPLRVTFHAKGRDPVSFNVTGSSAVKVESDDDDAGKEAADTEAADKDTDTKP
jgi:hypothetical protein